MSNLPERIWRADWLSPPQYCEGDHSMWIGPQTEYIRADIAAAQLAEANACANAAETLALERAVHAVRAIMLDPPYVGNCRTIVSTAQVELTLDAIRALSPMPPLQAAMQLPEVRALVEALTVAGPIALADFASHPFVLNGDEKSLVLAIERGLAALTADDQPAAPVMDLVQEWACGDACLRICGDTIEIDEDGRTICLSRKQFASLIAAGPSLLSTMPAAGGGE